MDIKKIKNENILCWFYIYNTDISNNRNSTGIVIIMNLYTNNTSEKNIYFIYCPIEDKDPEKNGFINVLIDNAYHTEINDIITKQNNENTEQKIVIEKYSNDSLKHFLIDHAK